MSTFYELGSSRDSIQTESQDSNFKQETRFWLQEENERLEQPFEPLDLRCELFHPRWCFAPLGMLVPTLVHTHTFPNVLSSELTF